jgi:hypothetical protein
VYCDRREKVLAYERDRVDPVEEHRVNMKKGSLPGTEYGFLHMNPPGRLDWVRRTLSSGNLVALVCRRSLLRTICVYVYELIRLLFLPSPTWSPLVYPLAFGTSCPLQQSSVLWLSTIMRICPFEYRRRPSQIQLLHLSPSTRSDVSATGRVHYRNRVNVNGNFANCSLSRSPYPPQCTGMDLQFC